MPGGGPAFRQPGAQQHLTRRPQLDPAVHALHRPPGEPLDRDLYRAPAKDLAHLTQAPQTLQEALDALEKDHAFLLRGGVFTPDVIEQWIRYKRQREVAPMRRRPHPYEFCLYYDA